ncbi:Stp1/IreP family PP2C-type Ser/Thr phosphatase [Streptomyces sp. TRM 70361]|uniref:Stp1/IreP family PP2C-type Ser/Thr phosphatase n=1 Tax=Streptomyces sp. TRM 70361 TaxID=3116553 RepID=UPI002E7B78A7|nr:Stp1/IreP family PP2C-type Ser/Thr phosphatase [Streptomyces sp. TRM 70361]MEE1939492.1 Stp1/IreP family PP2C-type Ser/Thr phosphatase [Streptomyces sp. TRM 70361]
MGTVRMYPEPTGEVRMSLALRFAAGSHKGMIREGNEDSGYAGPRLLAVADGMGGQAAGEVASSEVISILVQLDDDVPGSDLLTSLGSAVQRANEQLRVMVEEDSQLEGMGTTLTALLWTGRRLGLVHVGDSRAYLLRDGRLSQITQDHTWVQRLVDEGRITEEEATTHPQRSLLMRALGSGDRVEPDLSIREVRAGDRYLLCSDGLSGVVSHQTMEETLAGYQGPQETVQELIQLALRGGGPDNITCIVADVLDVEGGDTLAGQLNDTPVIVGAVAENQHQLGDPGTLQTPAARAAELGRGGHGPVPQQQSPEGSAGGFGPPGSGSHGSTPHDGSFDAYAQGDLGKPRGGWKWFRRSLYLVLVLGLIGGGLYGGWRWVQTQYYVGAEGDRVAIYRGISQKLGWIELSEVEERSPVELKYLPAYQRNEVRAGISMDSLEQAEARLARLAEQAEVCRLVAQQRQERERAEESQEAQDAAPGDAGRDGSVREGGAGAGEEAGNSPSSAAVQSSAVRSSGTPADGTARTGHVIHASDSTQSSTAPTPGPTLPEEQQKLAKQCTTP